MDRVQKITLISEIPSKDDIGQEIMQETGSEVICTVKSVTRQEWITAQQKALSAAYVVTVFFADYEGEKIAELCGERYEIYRTYNSGDYVELYLAEKVGELE